LVIFFGTLFFICKVGRPSGNLVKIFGGAFLFLTFGIFFFYLKTFKKESIAKTFFKIFNHRMDSKPLEIEKEIFDFFKLKQITTWKSFGLAFLRVILTYFRTLLLIIFLGEKISFLPVLSILGFSYLATMFPIPTSLGSHEAIQVFAFNSLGLSSSIAAAFTMIIRGAELIIAFAGLVILFRSGISLFKNTLTNQRQSEPPLEI